MPLGLPTRALPSIRPLPHITPGQRELNNKSLRGAAGLTNTNQEFCLKYCQCLIISAQQLYKSLCAKHSEYSRQFLWEILATIKFVCSRNVKRATGTGALQGNNSQSYHQAQPDHYYSLQSAASFYDFHKHGKHPSLSLSHCLGHWFSSLHVSGDTTDISTGPDIYWESDTVVTSHGRVMATVSPAWTRSWDSLPVWSLGRGDINYQGVKWSTRGLYPKSISSKRFEKNPGFEKNKIKQSTNCLDFHLFSSKAHLDDDVMYYWILNKVEMKRWCCVCRCSGL